MNTEVPIQQVRRELSKQLYPLGDLCPSLWKEFDDAGYHQALLDRNLSLSLAQDEAARYQILKYWVEYAKERIAGLVGPMSILTGELPEISAYRSGLLDQLREDRRQQVLDSNETHPSPQIESTLRRFNEMFYTEPFKIDRRERFKRARVAEAKAFRFAEMRGFYDFAPEKKYDLMVNQYTAAFAAHRFSPDLNIKGGSVFRKPISGTAWDLVFVDESRKFTETGVVETWVGITTKGRRVQPGSNRVVTMLGHFPIDDLIPGFGAYTFFRPQSCAEMCLACAANVCATHLIYFHVNELLAPSPA